MQETKTGPRILIVEDCQDIVDLLKLMLDDGGYVVRSAATIAEACAWLDSERFDLVLSDLSLPDGNGVSIPGHIRARCGDGTPTKAIAMSGYSDSQHVRASLEAGFTEHLVKPVDEDVLLDKLARATGQLKSDT